MCAYVCTSQTAAAEVTTPQSPHFLRDRRTTKRWATMAYSSCERVIAWNSLRRCWPAARHKTQPRDCGKEEKLLSTPWPPNTLWAPWGSWPSIVDLCPHKTPSVTTVHPHHITIIFTVLDTLVSKIHEVQLTHWTKQSLRKGHIHTLWDFSN